MLLVTANGPLTIALLFALSTVPASNSQVAQNNWPEVDQHISDLIKELPVDNLLRQQLVSGARGDGVRQPWMDDMRQEGVKRAVVWVNAHFNRRGKPKQMRVDRTEYFTRYERGGTVLGAERLELIRTSGLEQRLGAVALEKAAHGYWVDVPRPLPRPFVGTIPVELLDDEWLPNLKAPLY
jgi:hypothetical protein